MEVEIRWNAQGLVPAIVQDARTRQVLMLAYMNAAALERTLQSGETWFWSRSRQELWHKGASSGHTQRVLAIDYDCDADTLLVQVEPRGPACHTGQESCFYRHLPGSPQEEPAPALEKRAGGSLLERLWATIQERQAHPQPGSYTCSLLAAGEPHILRKVGEEAVEVIVAAQSEGDERLVSELADLFYHALVLLAARNLSWEDVLATLERRGGDTR
jgi:phosphoribosyl-ATP pyrophosphohydrolase/phosphoribosyl-AMP cyclohydrolase